MLDAILEDMKRAIIHVEVSKGDDNFFIAACRDLSVFTQGKTLDELAHNIREAIELALEGEDVEELGYIEHPSVLVSMELSLAHA